MEIENEKKDLTNSELVVNELEKQDFVIKSKQLRFDNMDFSRSKTSLRMRYEAEVELIQDKFGSLEEIRETLGLSRRKMCQLLMVDPSAWTRWTKGITKAPPHIYRALQWYLAINEKYPGLGAAYWLSSLANKEKNQILEEDKEKLKQELFNELLHEIEEQPSPPKVVSEPVQAPQIILQTDEILHETQEMLQILREDVLSAREQLRTSQEERQKLVQLLRQSETRKHKYSYLLICFISAFLISLLLIAFLL